MGTENFQVFGGMAYTFGEPSLHIDDRDLSYSGGNSWLWQAGISVTFPRFTVWRGAVSPYGELAWQPYSREGGGNFNFWHDLTANLRVTTGILYLWRI
jgi:hypothetical protein